MGALTVQKAVQERLTTRYLGRHMLALEEVDSTNTRARRWAQEGAEHGSVVLADHQTAGRGRMGRIWQSQAGQNLTFSVLFRPGSNAEHWGLVTIAASLAVVKCIGCMIAPLEAVIKWPNDILIDGRKVCGMLLESSTGGDPSIVWGIGLNVNQRTFPSALEQTATSLALATGRMMDRAEILADLLNALESNWDRLSSDPDGVVASYAARMTGIGAQFQVRHGAHVIIGRLRGIAPSGAAILETANGIETVYSGDVAHA